MVVKTYPKWWHWNYWVGNASNKSQREPVQERVINGFRVEVEMSCIFSKNTFITSQLDPNKQLSMKTWAVSIVIEHPSLTPGIIQHHTMLIIEGVVKPEGHDECIKFWRKAHLTGPGTTENGTGPQGCYSGHNNEGLVKIDDSKYKTFDLTRIKINRMTWVSSSESIKKLIGEIEEDANNPQRIFFRFLGENSFAREIRSIIDFGKFHQLKKEDPNKFTKMFILSRYFALFCLLRHNSSSEGNRSKQIISDFEDYLTLVDPDDDEINPLIVFFLLLPSYIVEGVKPADIIPQIFKSMMTLGWKTVNPVYISSKILESRVILNEIKENKNLLIAFIYQTQERKCTSQNCFNWARSKLKSLDGKIGEQIGESRWEKFGLIPEWYIPKQSNSSEHATSEVEQPQVLESWWNIMAQSIKISRDHPEVPEASIANFVTWDDLVLKLVKDPSDKATICDKIILRIALDLLFYRKDRPCCVNSFLR